MEEETGLEMGKRPSRQRRHLPTSVAAAASTRNTNHSAKNIPLLNMTFHGDEQRPPKEKTTSTKNRRGVKRATQKTRDKQLVTSIFKQKYFIWSISVVWIAFVGYRIMQTYQTEDYNHLSLVHFISNALLRKNK